MPTNMLSDIAKKSISNSEKLVSTKELAQMLGVEDRTIRNTVEKLGNDFRKSISVSSNGGRPSMMFNEQQATLIKIGE